MPLRWSSNSQVMEPEQILCPKSRSNCVQSFRLLFELTSGPTIIMERWWVYAGQYARLPRNVEDAGSPAPLYVFDVMAS